MMRMCCGAAKTSGYVIAGLFVTDWWNDTCICMLA
jgi:hypothetical protein